MSPGPAGASCFDRRLALRASGLLREANEAGLITAADVHVAGRLGSLAGETDDAVLLALALATRAVRHGSVCLDLREAASLRADDAPDEPAEAAAGAAGSRQAPQDDARAPLTWPEPAAWREAIAAGPLLAHGVLHLEDHLLYLDRYHREELAVAAHLRARARHDPPRTDPAGLEAGLRRVFPPDGFDEQREAARRAASSWTTVVTGGPGTGKTTTVAAVLALVAEQGERPPRIALTAPTGKAAARLGEAVTEAAARLPRPDRQRLGELSATTIHRLLGARPDNRTRFRHHRDNRLPHDLVVVDETSMVSLSLMARLLEALRPQARLVLVGDPDQLPSVDAGAVLADLVAGLDAAGPDASGIAVARLRTSHRFGAGIGALAASLISGEAEAALEVLRAGHPDVEFVDGPDPAAALQDRLTAQALALRTAALAGDAGGALEVLARHRLLCAHRQGPHGVRTWNRQVEQWLVEETGQRFLDPMYPGRPLLVTANDPALGLFNGDSGVVLDRGAGDGAVQAVLAAARGAVRVGAARLADVTTLHAMTIHQGQGSESDEVTVLLPPPESALLTRELFYTAVTRARRRVVVAGTEAAVRAAVHRRVRRASGLARRLASAG